MVLGKLGEQIAVISEKARLREIRKAQVTVVVNLAKALGCSVEDLIR